jgi:para-nitrobenzyl esterase
MNQTLLKSSLSFFLVVVTVAAVAQKGLDTVHTEGGLISGLVSEHGDIHVFKGIPFAAPPICPLRWKEPQPVAHWTGVRQCDTFSASPMQGKPAPFGAFSQEFLVPREPINEDCLYLNVWTGAHASGEKRPVIVWIYGGGFSTGGSAVPIYNGLAMAQKGAVFVSINYRVGIFGFLALPALRDESPHHSSGNYGLMDQVAALRWVQRNIAAFGGDPGNVTIAGQSAGSISVNCLLASPLTKGLFQKAIAESGAAIIASPFANMSLQKAEAAGSKIVASLNVTTLDDLRALPAEIVQRRSGAFWMPVVDGYLLPAVPADVYAAGKQQKVPLLTGWNEGDAIMFGGPPSAASFRTQAARQYGADSSGFLQLFPATNDSEAAKSQTSLMRDLMFGVQNYTLAEKQAEGSPVYVYRFAHPLPGPAQYGAFHGGEIVYAYDNLSYLQRPWERVDSGLADIMSAYWYNFVVSGNPNGKGLPPWPVFHSPVDTTMVFTETAHAAPLADKAALEFLRAKMLQKQ